MVIATIVPTRFWSIIWVGEPALLGRLHAERVVTSERDINRYLNVFNFSFKIIIVVRSYLKNGKLALKPKLGANEWILQMNNG
jgi:hypothetical protein